MLEAIEPIERYSVRGREAFDRDELIQSWFIRHLQIIGEAARSIPEEDFRAGDRVAQDPWMRHVLVHGYFGIDRDIVWSAVEHDLPRLKTALLSLRRHVAERD